MKVVKAKECTIIPPKDVINHVKTGKNMMKGHGVHLYIGKRNSGKSTACTGYLKMLMDEGSCNRIFVISSTFNSNKILMKDLNIDEDDVYDPDDSSVVHEIVAKINKERDDYIEYHDKMKRWRLLEKEMKTTPIEFIDDMLLLEFADEHGDIIKPSHKYGGKKPIIHVLCDDVQNTPLLKCKLFSNFLLRHRHIGAFEQGGALGCSIHILLQNYKGGYCPRVIKNNATSLSVFKIQDKQEIAEMYEGLQGEIKEADFFKCYEYATEEQHSFLLIDLHKKQEQPSMFRKRFDEYLIVN